MHKKAYYLRASSYLKKGKYNEALKDSNRLLEIDSKYIAAIYLRGCIYEKMNQIDKSIIDFTKVLELDPNHINAAYARGACENKRGNFLKAIKDYNLALSNDKKSSASPCHFTLKTANIMLAPSDTLNRSIKTPDKALQQFAFPEKVMSTPVENLSSNAIKKDIEKSNFLLYESNKSKDDSRYGMQEINNNELTPIREEDFSTIIGEDSKHLNISVMTSNSIKSQAWIQDNSEAEKLHQKGYDERKKENFSKAIEYYSMSLERYPNFIKALFNRGFAYDKIGKFELAIEDYSRAIELDSKNPYTYYNKGISLDKLKKYDEAIICFNQAIFLLPNKADFYHNRGFAFRKKEQFQLAIKDYTKAIQLDPKHFKVN